MHRPAWVEIDLRVLDNNIKTVQSCIAEGSQMLAVVKGNCYGHGLKECYPVFRANGVSNFAVATLDEAIELREIGDPADRIVLMPLYPQSAFSPTMAVVDSFQRAQDAIDWHPDSTIIYDYHDDQGYINAIVRSVSEAGFDAAAGDRLVLSFHAIPLKDEAAGDTYRAQIAESTRLIARGLGIEAESITVSFQSVFGRDESKWTAPLTRDVLKGWRNESFRVVFACPGFSIDCLETLNDIPHEMVPALEGEGAKPVVDHVGGDIQAACNTSGRFVWVPTLNASDEHAALLKSILDKSIGSQPKRNG